MFQSFQIQQCACCLHFLYGSVCPLFHRTSPRPSLSIQLLFIHLAPLLSFPGSLFFHFRPPPSRIPRTLIIPRVFQAHSYDTPSTTFVFLIWKIQLFPSKHNAMSTHEAHLVPLLFVLHSSPFLPYQWHLPTHTINIHLYSSIPY